MSIGEGNLVLNNLEEREELLEQERNHLGLFKIIMQVFSLQNLM
jgi:hypothetical protein